MAQAQGVMLLALTDGPLSPLAPMAAIAFEVQDAELSGFRSLVAQMCLSQALVFGVAAALQAARSGAGATSAAAASPPGAPGCAGST